MMYRSPHSKEPSAGGAVGEANHRRAAVEELRVADEPEGRLLEPGAD